MNKQETANKIITLAEELKLAGEMAAAGTLYGLAGSVMGGSDADFLNHCVPFIERDCKRIKQALATAQASMN